ncbi:MAG: hypothetical protein GF383_01715, partial [Candidatus Lokiarchaeota archaeon]|nr:hypothetical protein [Candidatus Lokiarchaeota archaeon]MBD3338024.1 hypothetical protein [Candidatus Lokiarchaeota archaeon]
DYSKLSEHMKEDICPHVGYFFGMSDGGHGPTHKEVAYANHLSELEMFKWSKVKTFYDKIERFSKNFPVWNDEMYLENHRGCFSNHSEVKRRNRKYENLLISFEKLLTLTSLSYPNFQYPREKMESLWKITLKNQFHDVLPGSSIPEVYDEVWDDWNEIDGSVHSIVGNISEIFSNSPEGSVNKRDREILLFNPLSWERESRLFIPATIFDDGAILNSIGKPNYARLEIFNGTEKSYICQPIKAESENARNPHPPGWWTCIKINALSLVRAKLTLLSDSESRKIAKKDNLLISESEIANNLITIKVDQQNGAITEVRVEGINDGNNLLKGTNSNLTYGFLDTDERFPAWNLTPEYWNHPLDLPNNVNLHTRVAEVGPIFATLEISKLLGISPVSQTITLFKNDPEIYLSYFTNWKQKKAMLKILYNTNTNAETVTADGMYCSVIHKTNPNIPCDKARFEKICHKYFDISTPNKEWGLTLINEGKYAFDVEDGKIRLTLLRSCLYPPPAPEAWVNEERKINEELYLHTPPEYSELGPFECRYAILPHKGGALTDNEGNSNPIVKRKAEEFNSPVIIVPLEGGFNDKLSALNLHKPLIEIDAQNVYLGALKKKEWETQDTLIVRFVEGLGVSTQVNVRFSVIFLKKIKHIKAVDLIERESNSNFTWDQNDGILSFEIGEFEIISFEIVL